MIRTYKCPGCGGQMNYKADRDALVCDHCGYVMTVSEAAAEDPDLRFRAPDEGVDTDGDNVLEYSCPACGARLVTDNVTAATVCAYCGSSALTPSRLSGSFRPNRVIPFRVEKKEAQKKLKEWAKSFKLTPSDFQSTAMMDKLTGVYVPYWLYSASAEAELQAEGRNISTETKDDEEITTTEYYDVARKVRNGYISVPYDASEKMPDDSMAGLEPFDYDELKEFKLPYLSGFQAEKYFQDASGYEDKAWKAIEEDIKDAAEETITGYDEKSVKSSRTRLWAKKSEYVLLPVWSLAYRYGGKNYPVFVNGQTGKIDGELPLSRGKVLLRAAVFFAAFFAAAMLLGLLAKWGLFAKFWSWLILGGIAGGIAALVAKGSHNKRTYTPKRHYAGGDLQILLKTDRYSHTDTERKKIEKAAPKA